MPRYKPGVSGASPRSQPRYPAPPGCRESAAFTHGTAEGRGAGGCRGQVEEQPEAGGEGTLPADIEDGKVGRREGGRSAHPLPGRSSRGCRHRCPHSPRWRGAMSSLPPAAPGPALPLLRPLAPPPPPGGGEGGAAPTAAAVRGAGCRGLCAAASTTQPGMGTAMGSSRRSSCRGQTPLRMSAAGGLL